MNTKPRPKLQAGESALGRMNHVRLNIISTLDLLTHAMERLANGECVAGKQIIEEVHSHIEDSSREELAMIASLADYEPVWRIDEALHERRKKFLDDRAKEIGASATWTDNAFHMMWDSNFVRVDAKDNWIANSGVPDYWVHGVGLTALYAHLKGQLLPETVALLTKWLETQRAAK